MQYIELSVKVHSIVHGYDDNNEAIIELVNENSFMKKLIAIHRIESISQDYLLIRLSHGRIAYWEYNEELSVIKSKMKAIIL